jgi:hypothetical protein
MRAKVSALLEAVVTADGVIRPEERDFVRRAASRWKLPDPDAPLSLRTLGSATEALRAKSRSRRTPRRHFANHARAARNAGGGGAIVHRWRCLQYDSEAPVPSRSACADR